MKTILLSAYACEPGRGSESGVGWGWLIGLTARHTVHLVTRENNLPSIRLALEKLDLPDGRVVLVGHEAGRFWLWLKRRRLVPVSVYYALWQLTLGWRFRRRLGDFDLVHHVTFNGFRTPGAWWGHRTRVVLGPLGGSAVAPGWALGSFGARIAGETLRTLSVRLWFLNPWTQASLRRADRVIVATGDLKDRLGRGGIECEVLLECAVPGALEEEATGAPAGQRRDFIWAGTIEPWKGWSLAWKGFARAFADEDGAPRLRVFGDGRQASRALRLAEELGVSRLILFEGRKSQDELWQAFRGARALVFPSVRDTSGNVILEALACGCPVICLGHQGAVEMTDDDCAIRIDPVGREEVIRDLGEAFRRLQQDDQLVDRMGRHGRERILRNFTWPAKTAAMGKIYRELVPGGGAPETGRTGLKAKP